MLPNVEIIPGAASRRSISVISFGETVTLCNDGGNASGGIALVDDMSIDGIFGFGPLRYQDVGKWSEDGTTGGASLSSTAPGLAFRRHNAISAISGMRSRKSFQSPNRNASGADLVPYPPWARLCLQMLIRFGVISGTGGTLNYQFGFDTNNDPQVMTAGDLIAFRVQDGGPDFIEAVVRLGAGTTAVTLANTPDDDWHLYEIEVFMARGGVNPDGPNFYIDGVLVQAFTASEGNVPRGPYYAKMQHASKPAPEISCAYCAVWYDVLRSVLT